MIVTGVDLSLTGTGLARVVGPVFGAGLVRVETVRSNPSGKSVEARAARLGGIVSKVDEFMLPGSLVVIEAPAFSRQAGARHERSGLWWMVAAAAIAKGCRVVEVSPRSRSLYAAGSGAAGKERVLAAMRAEWLGVDLANDNEADALALAALGMRLVGFPVDLDSSSRLQAVEAVVGEL